MRQYFRLGIIIIPGILLLSACSSSAPDTGASIQIYSNHFAIQGKITNSTVNRFEELVAEYPEITQLHISSETSDPMAAMQMGYLLQRNEFDLFVTDVCTQACANYIFTAAKTRTVEKGAVVAWSGGALEQSKFSDWTSTLFPGVGNFIAQNASAYLRRETRFFNRINVDQYITVYGFDQNIGCMTEHYEGFYYSEADLLSMGLGPSTFAETDTSRVPNPNTDRYCQVDLSNRLLLIN
ncbi:hypothetical protein A28LD_0066 [Idiomarina sp. A28L]|uniref:hypothetical protein n=1 Tax=Idiomarina sp. A28L TaxID=1036674 RepID=UPI0002138607|nr:hypothetical protein [Idiomarina sp. A28L]EGN76330.1 hypothetical protein A28LD_0066 [Idiomarina sp. A28L]